MTRAELIAWLNDSQVDADHEAAALLAADAGKDQEIERLRDVIRMVERQSSARQDITACAMLKKEIASWKK